jgi:hypothetical protein
MNPARPRFASLLRHCAVASSALLLAGCPFSSTQVRVGSAPAIVGSGKPATENRPTGAFSRIDASGAVTVDLAIGPAPAISVTMDDNLLPYLATKIEGDTLRIYSTQSYNTSSPIKIKIVTPALEAISLSGACSLHAVGLDAKAFALDISGTGDVNLAGKADSFTMHLSGAGNLESTHFTARDVKVDISGVGNADVCATNSLDATVSGAGNVHYTGSPAQVRKNVSGVGSIKGG